MSDSSNAQKCIFKYFTRPVYKFSVINSRDLPEFYNFFMGGEAKRSVSTYRLSLYKTIHTYLLLTALCLTVLYRYTLSAVAILKVYTALRVAFVFSH